MIGLKTMSRFTRSALLIIGAITFMLCPTMMRAQGASIFGQALTSTGKPAAYATVRVCAYAGGGIPCTPLSSLYSDLALTQPASNPYTADGYGNFSVFVASGNAYLVQLNVGSGITYAYQVTAGGVGGGTVSSVGLTVPTSILSVSGSPITGAGTFAVTLANQSANTMFLGPATGSAAAPTFRAPTPADIAPAGTLTNSTTGNAATATALAATPSQCASGSAPTGIAASGAAQNCTPYLQSGAVVTKIINGTGITVSPSGGTGNVTVSEALPFTSLTTTGTGGGASISSGVLNIPQYCNTGGCLQLLPGSGVSQAVMQGDSTTLEIEQVNNDGSIAAVALGHSTGGSGSIIQLDTGGAPGTGEIGTITIGPEDVEMVAASSTGANGAAGISLTTTGADLTPHQQVLSANQNSPMWGLGGSYVLGGAYQPVDWRWQDVVGTGSTPSEVLTLSHSGNPSGTQAISIPFPVGLGVGSTVNSSPICTTTTGCGASGGTATNLAGGVTGSLPYQSAANITAFLAGNTAATDQVLTSTGTGSAAQAPTLKNAPALSAANMTGFPTLNQNTTGLAGNVTATTNSTLTTLSALSLPNTQVTGLGTMATQNASSVAVTGGNVRATIGISEYSNFLDNGNNPEMETFDGWGLQFSSIDASHPMQFINQSIYVGNAGPAATNSGTGNVFFSGNLIAETGAPTCTVGAAAGSGATCAILSGSTNTSGQVTITTGTATVASGTLVTITFNGTVYAAPRNCPITPRNAAAAVNATDVFATAPTTTAFTIGDGGTTPAISTANVWGYGPCI